MLFKIVATKVVASNRAKTLSQTPRTKNSSSGNKEVFEAEGGCGDGDHESGSDEGQDPTRKVREHALPLRTKSSSSEAEKFLRLEVTGKRRDTRRNTERPKEVRQPLKGQTCGCLINLPSLRDKVPNHPVARFEWERSL
jgi:hypothetical protein